MSAVLLRATLRGNSPRYLNLETSSGICFLGSKESSADDEHVLELERIVTRMIENAQKNGSASDESKRPVEAVEIEPVPSVLSVPGRPEAGGIEMLPLGGDEGRIAEPSALPVEPEETSFTGAPGGPTLMPSVVDVPELVPGVRDPDGPVDVPVDVPGLGEFRVSVKALVGNVVKMQEVTADDNTPVSEVIARVKLALPEFEDVSFRPLFGGKPADAEATMRDLGISGPEKNIVLLRIQA